MFTLGFSFFVEISFLNAQSINSLKILDHLHQREAFLAWQKEWRQHLPNLNISEFKLRTQENFKLSNPEKINSSKLSPFIIINPSGNKALLGWTPEIIKKENDYHLAWDDGSAIRLFDFSTDTSFQILYGKWIRGIAWLNEDLFVTVGEFRDLKGENDRIVPEVSIFDLNSLKIHSFIGDFILISDYFKKRKSPLLMLTELNLSFK